MMLPVGNQLTAVTVHDRPLLVEAGAGTGKTWTLVQRFLHLLDQHPEWPLESIVAVTFTEKAAREMRTRLRKAIESRAQAASEGSHWLNRRTNLVNLQVGTIHSLCARILRENAITAGLDPYFSVLDELQAESLQEAALRQALDEIVLSDSPALELLAGLQVRDLRDQMAGLLGRRGTVQRLFDQLENPQELLGKWRTHFAEMQVAVWADAMAGLPGMMLETLEGVVIKDEADKLALAVQLSQAGCQCARRNDIVGACQAWLQINLTGGKADNWGGKENLADIKTALKMVREAARQLEKAGCLDEIGELDAQAALALQHWRMIWDHTAGVYQRVKADRQVLDFDDLELLAEGLLNRHPPDPRLQAFLDSLNHLMVDEYQDTNEVQWHILYALAHPTTGGRLFVVGDAKQSIYRFRQAQVTVFNQTAKDIQSETGSPPVRLETSFRSHRALTNALNHLFTAVLKPISSSYQDYEARPGPLQAVRDSSLSHPVVPAPVELCLIPAQDEQGERINAESARIYEAQFLAQRLIELETTGFPVWDKALGKFRPFRFGDAAILFRATTSLPLYEEQFKAAGLPYLTVSGRGYFDRPEVRDLIALLAVLHNPADDLNLAAALRSPIFGLSDETLYRLRWHTSHGSPSTEAISFAEALKTPPPTDQYEIVHFANQVLEELWQLAGRIDPWRLMRRILDLTGYEAALALNDSGSGGSGRSRSNVLKLLEIARQRSAESLSMFLNGLRDLSTREAREGEALGSAPESGAVLLLSIHAAKGLEFPVVAVADLGRRIEMNRSAPMILHDPAVGLVCKQRDENGDWQKPVSYAWGEWMLKRMEAAESKRLLYVACTRAADLLILSGKSGEQNSWLAEIESNWLLDPAEELQQFDGFSVRIVRPSTMPVQEPVVEKAVEPVVEMVNLPQLVRPLPADLAKHHYAVTHLQRSLLEKREGETTTLYPAVRVQSRTVGLVQPPLYLVGRVVHRLLANWGNLSLPTSQLEERLAAYARRERITHPEAVRQTVERSLRMLAVLRRTDIFRDVSTALQRHSEVPFSIASSLGDLHGVIDLLYQDRKANWQLVDWKTDWFPAEQLREKAQEYCQQIAVYDRAVRKILGVKPVVRVCFLAVQARTYQYTAVELEESLAELF